ncbi:MAG TPA: type VI secretion system membrane subunit TssM [Bryobacteraceae bacterium]|nr:type VI secretion system membrane subunit TssM [Bryobacteraceae bacterium]
MTKRRLLISILLFLIYVAAVYFGAAFFVQGTNLALVVFVMVTLGLTVLVVYLLISRMQRQHTGGQVEQAASVQSGERPATKTSAAADDPDVAALAALIVEANARLAKSPKLASRGIKTEITRLPLFLIGGLEGSGKTSTFLKSGLEPELLAGQVFRDSAIVPTRLANLWFAEDCLFAELSGSAFSGDAGRWAGLLNRLQGRSAGGFIKNIFGAKTDAQLRGFILLCDVTPFLGVPDPSRLGGLGRRIQDRLRVVGESFGTNFPVYVVFTKSDSIPYFTEYFARLVENEDQQILGCTLPATAPGARPAGEVYAEGETARLSDALNRLYYSLAEKRLSVLPRETEASARPAVYEFPREVKRIKDTLVQFLVDVFRPNPLQPGPILRGVYFTGTRQVTVSALGPVASEPVARAMTGEATSLFDLAEYQRRMGLTPEAAPSSPLESSIQRWCFVAELFHRVILPDPLGRAVAFQSKKTDSQRRIAFGAAAALALILGFIWIRSWWNNGSLLGGIETAAQASYAFQPNARAVPSLETLKGLDGLREQLETLLDYDRNGPPWRMRWGLFTGARVLPSTYNLYFERFRHLFLDDIQASLLGTLVRLPGSPNDQNPYNGTYDRLKAYRMITQCKCTPDPAFLKTVLADTWLAGRNIDPDRQALASKQLVFYAEELKIQNPYKIGENNEAVERGRQYLSSFGGVERLYRGIIEEANKSPRVPARLADIAPNYKQALSSPGEVQAAFSKEGFTFVNSAIKDPSRLTLGEPCVLGGMNAGAQLLQGVQVQTDLQNLYIQDYIRRWKAFVDQTSVDSFRSAADAAKRLEILADNRSPLLSAVFMISDNTNYTAAKSDSSGLLDKAVDKIAPPGAKKALDVAKQLADSRVVATPADIGRVFQPAREIVSPNNRERLIDDPNRTYMNALADLQRAMQRLQDDRASNPDMSLHEAARKATDTGLDAVRQIAQRFNIAESQGIDDSMKRLLEAPFRESLKYIITDPTKVTRDKANGAMRTFCARLMPLQKKFPFLPSSDVDATADEMNSIFAPQSGAFTALQQQVSKLVVKQGKQWVANPQSQDAKPSEDFLRFLNRLQQIQDALYSEGSAQFKMQYSLKPIVEQNVEGVTLDIDGHKITAGKNEKAQSFNWPGSNQVLVTVRAGGNIPFGSYSGPWAVLRWMYDADPRTGGSKVAQWSMLRQGHGQPQAPTDAQGHPIVLHVEISEFPSGVDIFDRNFFTLRCPTRAAE